METLEEIIGIIIGYAFIIYIIKIIIKKIKQKKEQIYNTYNQTENQKEIQENNKKIHEYYRKFETKKIDEEIQQYKLNNNIFTDTERFFYKVLREITKKLDLDILTKVRLADIVYTNNNNYKYFNKIKAKHIDFVLIDKDGNIKLLIELDDKSHLEPERQKRDLFINNIFKDKKIKLLRIQAKYIYNETELEEKIKESL